MFGGAEQSNDIRPNSAADFIRQVEATVEATNEQERQNLPAELQESIDRGRRIYCNDALSTDSLPQDECRGIYDDTFMSEIAPEHLVITRDENVARSYGVALNNLILATYEFCRGAAENLVRTNPRRAREILVSSLPELPEGANRAARRARRREVAQINRLRSDALVMQLFALSREQLLRGEPVTLYEGTPAYENPVVVPDGPQDADDNPDRVTVPEAVIRYRQISIEGGAESIIPPDVLQGIEELANQGIDPEQATRIIEAAIESARANDPNADTGMVARSALQNLQDMAEADGFNPLDIVTSYVDTVVENPEEDPNNITDDYLVFIRRIPEEMSSQVSGSGAQQAQALDTLRRLFLDVREDIFVDEDVENYLAGVTSPDNLENGALAERNDLLAAIDPQIAAELMEAIRERLDIDEADEADDTETTGELPTLDQAAETLAGMNTNEIEELMSALGEDRVTQIRDSLNINEDAEDSELVRQLEEANEELVRTALDRLPEDIQNAIREELRSEPEPSQPSTAGQIPATRILDPENGLLDAHIAQMEEDEVDDEGEVINEHDYNAPQGIPPRVIIHQVRFEGEAQASGAEPSAFASTPVGENGASFDWHLLAAVDAFGGSTGLTGAAYFRPDFGFRLSNNWTVGLRLGFLAYGGTDGSRLYGAYGESFGDAMSVYGGGFRLYDVALRAGGPVGNGELGIAGGLTGTRHSDANDYFSHGNNPFTGDTVLGATSRALGLGLSYESGWLADVAQVGINLVGGWPTWINMARDEETDAISNLSEEHTEEDPLMAGAGLRAAFRFGDQDGTNWGIQLAGGWHGYFFENMPTLHDYFGSLGLNLVTGSRTVGNAEMQFLLDAAARVDGTSGSQNQPEDSNRIAAGLLARFPFTIDGANQLIPMLQLGYSNRIAGVYFGEPSTEDGGSGSLTRPREVELLDQANVVHGGVGLRYRNRRRTDDNWANRVRLEAMFLLEHAADAELTGIGARVGVEYTW